MTKKKKKKNDWDDGRVIAPMTGEELPPYRRGLGGAGSGPAPKNSGAKGEGRGTQNGAPPQMSKKEERALTRALFLTMLPRLVVCLVAFGLVFLLGYLWLTH